MNADTATCLGRALGRPLARPRRVVWLDDRRFFYCWDLPLFADAERLDQRAIAIEVFRFEVVEQPTALSDQHE